MNTPRTNPALRRESQPGQNANPKRIPGSDMQPEDAGTAASGTEQKSPERRVTQTARERGGQPAADKKGGAR